MSHDILAIIIFAAVGLGLPLVTISMSMFLRPRKPYREVQQDIPYETGSYPKGRSRTVGFGYYQYAVLFLLFDFAAFVLAFAAIGVKLLTDTALLSIFFFIVFLTLTIAYTMKSKDYLEV